MLFKSILFLLSTMAAQSVFAEEIPNVCYNRAEKSVGKVSEDGQYDDDGISARDCGYARNGRAVICEVSASKGDGAATDIYRVVLNKQCSKTFRVELISEE